jgi:hypothetical protein
MALQPFVGSLEFFQFRIPIQSYSSAQTQNKDKQTSLPRVGCESTTQAFYQSKILHALERAATVIGSITLPAASEKHSQRHLQVAGLFSSAPVSPTSPNFLMVYTTARLKPNYIE